MKVALLFEDELLIHRFKEQKSENALLLYFDHPERLLASRQSFDAVVLSDRFFNFSSLCEYIELIREEHKEIKITVLLSNKHNVNSNEKYIKYCLSNQIHYVHPGQSASQIKERVYQHVFGGVEIERPNNKNVVVFLGSTPNVGTTVASFCTAMQIARQTKQQIGYICLNLKSSKIHKYMGIDQPAVTLDGIRAEVTSQGLNKERLKSYCVSFKETANLHVLFGNLMREQAEFYSVEDINHLLNTCSAAFDLCIVEVSAYWDNAATVCALLYADTKIVVSTSQLGHFQEDMNRWLKSISPVFDIDIGSFDLFVTQIQGSSNDSFRLKDIRKETGMNIVGHMRACPFINEHLNQGKISDLAINHSGIVKDLSGLVNMLATLYHLEKIHPLDKKKWINRLVGGQE